MAYETLIVERDGPVDRVTLNRPDRLNTLDDTMIAELSGYFGGLATDRACRVVVLKGAGRGYCAGLDLTAAGGIVVVERLGIGPSGPVVVFVERCPLGLLILGREQRLQGVVALVDQFGDALLPAHHRVRALAGQRHRVGQDGLRQLDGLLDGDGRRAYQKPDSEWCSRHGPQPALPIGHLQVLMGTARAGGSRRPDRTLGAMPTLDVETANSSAASGAQVAAGHTGKRVLLAEPRGYCAGVDRAVETVERALEKHGAPVYVRHEIVHNKHVVDTLTKAGAVFVHETDEVPEGARVAA